ncbi:MAG: hypothetical protein ACI88A_004414 [Paraglaciecola sp.]|jgi:hypothetical protein
MNPVFFTHIPKTAGTSFRLGIEDYLGQESIAYDYGLKSKETSGFVRELLYGEVSDPWYFYRECQNQGIRFVGGHVGIRRFVTICGIGNSVTFVREPLRRVVSEFEHFVRNYGYEGTMMEFCCRPVMQNRQSRILQGVPLEGIGFIGVTERYVESIELINARFSWSVAVREDNIFRDLANGEPNLLNKSDEKELRQLNQKDIALYRQCTKLFDTRYKLYQSGLRFCHARIQQSSVQNVTGWAWWEDGGDKPVEIELLLNGEPTEKKLATDLRPGLCWFHPPRGAHVGFSFPKAAKEGDSVQCRISETGQCFPSKPIFVTKS